MPKLVPIFIALCVAGSAPTVALAGPLQDGAAAFERGDYPEAMKILRPVADQGDALAQVMVGDMFAEGKGVSEDDAEGLRWFSLSAAQGNDNGEASLGVVYLKAKDYAQALHWFGLSAAQGYERAQYALGIIYEYGEGTAKDRTEALRWYRLAAAQGDADAAKAVERLTQGN